MKVSKSLFITAFAAGSLLAGNLALQAQDATNTPPTTPPAGGPPPGHPPGGPGMRGRPNFDMIAQQLNLTDDQKPKFRSIIETRMQKMRDLRQDPGFATMSPEDRRAKVKAIQDEMETQMKTLLTPEQFEKWQKMPMAGMRERRMFPPPGGGNAGSTNAPAAAPATPPQQ
jgi:Spy/CpxP family protein refolding chaperone